MIKCVKGVLCAGILAILLSLNSDAKQGGLEQRIFTNPPKKAAITSDSLNKIRRKCAFIDEVVMPEYSMYELKELSSSYKHLSNGEKQEIRPVMERTIDSVIEKLLLESSYINDWLDNPENLLEDMFPIQKINAAKTIAKKYRRDLQKIGLPISSELVEHIIFYLRKRNDIGRSYAFKKIDTYAEGISQGLGLNHPEQRKLIATAIATRMSERASSIASRGTLIAAYYDLDIVAGICKRYKINAAGAPIINEAFRKTIQMMLDPENCGYIRNKGNELRKKYKTALFLQRTQPKNYRKLALGTRIVSYKYLKWNFLVENLGERYTPKIVDYPASQVSDVDLGPFTNRIRDTIAIQFSEDPEDIGFPAYSTTNANADKPVLSTKKLFNCIVTIIYAPHIKFGLMSHLTSEKCNNSDYYEKEFYKYCQYPREDYFHYFKEMYPQFKNPSILEITIVSADGTPRRIISDVTSYVKTYFPGAKLRYYNVEEYLKSLDIFFDTRNNTTTISL